MVSWNDAARHFWFYRNVDVDWEELYFTCPSCKEKIHDYEWDGYGTYPSYGLKCPHCGEVIMYDKEEQKRVQAEDDLIVLMNTIGLF